MDTEKIIAQGPRPDFYRENFFLLNGEWGFAFDDEDKGKSEQWYLRKGLDRKIRVPYCFQSKQSGIGDTSAHEVVWYQREVAVPEGMAGKQLWLCFGAVDYEADIWINGQHAFQHKGGHTSFEVPLCPYIKDDRESVWITVRVFDPYDTSLPRGKQHWSIHTDRCWYTATTGIWQDIWLEAVEGVRVNGVKIVPDIDQKCARVELRLEKELREGHIQWRLTFKNRLIREGSCSVEGREPGFTLDVFEEDPIDNGIHLWSCEHPNLYHLELRLATANGVQDHVRTYFGMRKIETRGDKILLNHYPLYQRLILDQGYWPDTLLTPPSDEALIRDIELTKAMGFNGVRKHQKIESPRFLYYADIMGLLVWSEMPSNYTFGARGMSLLSSEWMEVIQRNYNHPCIIVWVPLNESWGVRDIVYDKQQQDFAQSLYHLTKALDKTRLVSTNDGWEMVSSDMCSIHDYCSDGNEFYEKYSDKEKLLQWTAVGKMLYADGFGYEGQPFLVSEFGGIAFEDGNANSWGYNDKVTSEEAFLQRVQGLARAIEKLGYTSGYCYTQLTDVQQETNGLLFADRRPKVAVEKLKKIFAPGE